MESKFQDYLKYFEIEEREYDLIPITNSHINDTYRVQDRNGVNRYIIQRINSYVFPQPEKVMENIVLVTEHIQKKCQAIGEENLPVGIADHAGESDTSMKSTKSMKLMKSMEFFETRESRESRETLRIIPTKDGKSYLEMDGNYIRMFEFIRDAYSCDEITSQEEFRQVAVAIGRFHKLLRDIDVSKVNVTIEDFHNTPKRLEGFKQVVTEDPKGRADNVRAEIEFILQREALARSFEGKIIDVQNTHKQNLGEGKEPKEIDGLILRVTHNDTKPANVMLDKHTGRAVCMIDLDTIMPGLICDDFGDAIRSGTCKVREEVAGEGEKAGRKITACEAVAESIDVGTEVKGNYFDKELYDTFYEAFVEECKDFLTPMEMKMLPVGAMKITYEQALRFLEDYLKGDVYFKVSDEEQNLRRARVQMLLLQDMEKVLIKETAYE